MRVRRLPIRTRLTASFVLGLALVLVGFSSFVYVRTSGNLLEEVDAGLRSRAQVLAADVRAHGPALPSVESALLERDEAFAQITDRSGQVLSSSAIVSGGPLVGPATVAAIAGPDVFDERVPHIDNVTRVIAVPVRSSGTSYVILVGASLQDRRDQVLQLGVTLAAAGLAALALAGLGAWWIVGAALQPVDRMRQRADTISSADPGTRLPVQAGQDEISRLAATLNAMLDRIDEATTRERELVDRASHELRTPLAIQRVGLDLALSGPDTLEALRAGLREASLENTHLARLADDLLVVSRARGGQLPVHRRDIPLAQLLEEAVARNAATASARSIDLDARIPAPPGAVVHVDPDWTRQALDDLLDNAIRMTPPGGSVRLRGRHVDGAVRMEVEDTGPGFDEAFLPRAFDPFVRGAAGDPPSNGKGNGAGLGLSIVRAIAEAHGGSAEAENIEGGARVTLVLR